MPDAPDPMEIVARLIEAIETGELDAVRSLYAPGALVWTNFDDRERNVESSMGVLDWLVSNTTERRYDVTRRIAIEGGVLQQHVLRGTSKHRDREFSMPACLVIRVEGEAITRIDEYLDPSAVTAAIG